MEKNTPGLRYVDEVALATEGVTDMETQLSAVRGAGVGSGGGGGGGLGDA